MPRRASLLASLALGSILAACGGGGERAEAGSPGGTANGNATAEATTTEFSAADLDAYQRGLAREIELVKAARAAADTASTPASRGAAMQAQFETETIPEGAKASGLGERYAGVRQVVHDVMRTLDMQGRIDGPVSIDTATAPPEMKAQLARDPIAALPSASAGALRSRLDALAMQWAEYIRLTAVGG